MLVSKFSYFGRIAEFNFSKDWRSETCVATRFDGNSELVAELVTANGFKAAYAIKDGAEGARGWMVCQVFLFLHSYVTLYLTESVQTQTCTHNKVA